MVSVIIIENGINNQISNHGQDVNPSLLPTNPQLYIYIYIYIYTHTHNLYSYLSHSYFKNYKINHANNSFREYKS